jgi:hypothetical protein
LTAEVNLIGRGMGREGEEGERKKMKRKGKDGEAG